MSKIQKFPDPVDIFDHISAAMVRDPKHYHYHFWGDSTLTKPIEEYIENRERITKIQLGSGFKHLEGWRNLEYPDWDADKNIPVVGRSATEMNAPKSFGLGEETDHAAQPSSSVHEIASYHTLDHLSPRQVINVLREVERVLVPGGTFTNIVPHADSQLAKECIHHQSRFMIDTWRNIFSERQYEHDGEWELEVGLNFTFAIAERNTVLCTQLIKKGK